MSDADGMTLARSALKGLESVRGRTPASAAPFRPGYGDLKVMKLALGRRRATASGLSPADDRLAGDVPAALRALT